MLGSFVEPSILYFNKTIVIEQRQPIWSLLYYYFLAFNDVYSLWQLSYFTLCSTLKHSKSVYCINIYSFFGCSFIVDAIYSESNLSNNRKIFPYISFFIGLYTLLWNIEFTIAYVCSLKGIVCTYRRSFCLAI